MLNPVRDENEGKHTGGRRADTCEQGLSRMPLRVKQNILRVDLESKSDGLKINVIGGVFCPLVRPRVRPGDRTGVE